MHYLKSIKQYKRYKKIINRLKKRGKNKMFFKIKKFLSNLRVFKRIKVLMASIDSLEGNNAALRKDLYIIKGQMIEKRKTIKELNDNLIKTVNDLNLVAEKKKKGEILIGQLVKRRDELLHRIGSKHIEPSIATFADYKFWIAEPFIKEAFKHYEIDEKAIDAVSAIKGLGSVIKNIDEKSEEKK